MPTLSGQLVRLRPMEPSDTELFETLEYDDDSNRLGSAFVAVPWSRHRLSKWLEEESAKKPEGDVYRFVIETLADQTAAGIIQTNYADRRVGIFTYGLQIIPPHRRRGYGHDAVRVLLGYFFEELGYQKCNITVYDFNEASLAFHAELGFVGEGTLRRNVYTAGAFHDEVLFGLTREEFAALRALPR